MKAKFKNIIRVASIFALSAATVLTLPSEVHAKKTSKSGARHSGSGIQNILNNPDSAVWVRKGKKGLIVSKDSLGKVRGMSVASVNSAGAKRYAATVNRLVELLKDQGVKVYAMPVPNQGDFYMPAVAGEQGNERKSIRIAGENMVPEAIMVYVGDTLANHTSEDIFSRTDHHWSPLGGYYGAKALAAAAKVPFRPLSAYKTDTIPNYVGTMVMYTGDSELKKYPEDFVYYIPPVDYEAEFITYKGSSESAPTKAPFFKRASGSSSYCVFMGGDKCAVKVKTSVKNGRKLLIVKDSFGNAVASNLFGSFEEVHVLDFRYFPHNLIDYIKNNGITDFALVNTRSLAFSPNLQKRYEIMTGNKSVSKKQDPSDKVEETELDPWAK